MAASRAGREAVGGVLVVKEQTEAQFQAAVIQYAKLRGWMHYHTHNSRRSVAGFPDLLFLRACSNGSDVEMVVAELKAERGRISPEQEQWLAMFHQIPGRYVRTYLWRPTDWAEIEAVLR